MTSLVVKDNALIQASYTLDTVEQRLILLAVAEARETGLGISDNTTLEIHASSYMNIFNVEKHTAYTVLKNACRSLFDRYVTYHDKNPKNGCDRSFHCRWVDKIGYEQQTGTLYLRFTKDVVPLITRIESNFTKYEIQQISKLTSSYAIRLYELLIQWKSAGKTPCFELSLFKAQLGAEGQYATMSNFKRFVLDFAIKQINEHTDIYVGYEPVKKGRAIIGFIFKIKVKTGKLLKNTLSNHEVAKDKPQKIQRYPLSGLAEMNFKRLKEAFPEITLNELYDLAEKDGETIEITIQRMLPVNNILPSFIKQIELQVQTMEVSDIDTGDLFSSP